MNTARILMVAILALTASAMVAAYPTVTITTPYVTPEPPKTTVIYSNWNGNTYVHNDNGDTRSAYAIAYDRQYRTAHLYRDPYYCQYDWFDRCKDGSALRDSGVFDSDYWYQRCHTYDYRDSEWYDRNCDNHYDHGSTIRYRNQYYTQTYVPVTVAVPVDYTHTSTYNYDVNGYSYGYNYRTYAPTYPQYYEYTVTSAPYTNSVYYQGY